MIKEKKKSTKYNYKKTNTQLALEYLRTVLCSVLVGVVITSCLAIHARNEMIKDIYASAEEQNVLDRKLAIEIITQTNLLKDLKNKKYSVCMHAGEIYEVAGDYKDARRAYELAISKTAPNNYKPYYCLVRVLAEMNQFDDAFALLDNVKDVTDKSLIKFKTRSYLTLGDKYYSIGKFLSAVKSYEKARFYYDTFAKRDAVVVKSINDRIVNSYINAADIMVKSGLNSEAVRFLRKAEEYDKKDFNIRYKLAIILSDLDPEKSVEYFEELLEERPQDIDYSVYNRALLKAATIADLDYRPTKAKYYRYKIHSIDLFVNRKVVYPNDVQIDINSLKIRKNLFSYPIKVKYDFLNTSSLDLINLKGDFLLCNNDKVIETVTMSVSNKNNPLFSYADTPNTISVNFKSKIFTKKELANYTVKIYLYKDEKYKTLVREHKLIQEEP